MTVGSELSALSALSGVSTGSDLLYTVRGVGAGSGKKMTVSQLRITASQISDSGSIGQSLMQATSAGGARTTLGLGALAILATVGTGNIDDASVTLAKMAALVEDSIIIGDATNRPAAFALSSIGKALMQAADTATAQSEIGLGTIATQDADDVAITGGIAKFTGATPSASATGEVQAGGGWLDYGDKVLYRGTQILGAQGALVADASGGAIIDVEGRAAINALLARVRAHGIIAT